VDNLRPCPAAGGLFHPNNWGNEEYFKSRCDRYSANIDCDTAWELFSEVWDVNIYYDNNNPPDYTSFIDFFDWEGVMKANHNQPLFYSGTGQCPDVVHSLSNVTGVGLITLEDQDGPYSVANAGWCNNTFFNATTGFCTNFTVWGAAPNGNQLTGNNNYPGAAFWGPASENFAKSSFGLVWALIKSFEKGSTLVPAYQPGSIFKEIELPSVMQQPNVTGFRIMVISNANQPNETCGSGSLVPMFNNLTIGGFPDSRCIVDPPCVLQFVCNYTFYVTTSNSTIVDAATRCTYFAALQAANASAAATNCQCSTDSITMHGDGSFSTTTPQYCPIPVTGTTATGSTTTTTTGTKSAGSSTVVRSVAWLLVVCLITLV